MSNARDKANIPSLNFSSTGIDDNATSTAITIDSSQNVDVVGTTTSSNFILDGTGYGIKFPLNGTATLNTNSNSVIFTGSGASGDYLAGTLNLQSRGNLDRDINLITGATPSNTLTAHGNGDISFYEDTGTTAKLFWDASAERLGIGTTSPKEKLDSRGSAVFSGDHATATNAFGTSHGILISSTPNLGRITAVSNGANDVKLELRGLDGGNANSNQLILDGGTSNVGIGVTPSSTSAQGNTIKGLVLGGNNANGVYTGLQILNRVENSTTSNGISIDFDHKTSGATTIPLARLIALPSSSTSGNLRFYTSTSSSLSERMRINSSGNVGIGTTTPITPLQVNRDISGVTDALSLRANSNVTNEYIGLNFAKATWGRMAGIYGRNENNGNANGRLCFFTSNNGSFLERLTIQANGNSTFSNNLTVNGSLSKNSGSFKIDHPLPEKTNTHHLVHSFTESPQADLIYRGKIDLVNGTATVNIDTVSGMTEGTFVLLNRDIQCFTSNETGWTAVKGSVSGNTLTITAQDNTCTDTISWMVIGERQDQHMIDTDWTDDNGKVIVEPLKETEE